VHIIAGSLLGKNGPVKALSALSAATIYMEAGANQAGFARTT
jgi:hypothetical protein